ncbi:hypothetical protein D3C80_1733620 [compost metagenome]
MLALAGGEAVEKVLEIPIALVAPMKLAAQALHPAFTAAHHRITLFIGEVDMRPRQPLLEQRLAEQIDQGPTRVGIAQQARASDR